MTMMRMVMMLMGPSLRQSVSDDFPLRSSLPLPTDGTLNLTEAQRTAAVANLHRDAA
jgi:hypothetical protein